MSRALAITCLTGAGLLSSCASLRTEVKVLDQTQLDPVTLLLEAVPRMRERAAAVLRSGELPAIASTVVEEVTPIVGAKIDEWASSKDPILAKEDLPRLKEALADYLRVPFNRAEQAYRVGVDAALRASVILAAERSNPKQRQKLMGHLTEARDAFAGGDAALVADAIEHAIRLVGADVEKVQQITGAEEEEIHRLQLEVEQLLVRLRPTLKRIEFRAQVASTHASALIEDAKLALVVSAPDEAWESLYNQVWAEGRFGNVDIAVIKESNSSGTDRIGKGVPEFSLKGVRLDAGSVTRATFQGVKEMLRVAAAMGRVPMSAGGDAAGTELEPDSSARDREIESEAERDGLRQSAVHLLDALVVLGPAASHASATAERREAAIEELTSALARYRVQIEGASPLP
jgi:hypothetical protein